ncbi:MAG: hypothetical protein RL318_2299 [Fibrobacterota bacterium]|jgi:hypothetical protein
MKRSLFILALACSCLVACGESSGGATASPATTDPTAVTYPKATANTEADINALKALGSHGAALGKTAMGTASRLKDVGDEDVAGRIAARLSLANAYRVDSSLMYCQGSVCSETVIPGVVPDTAWDTIISHTGTGTMDLATFSSDSIIYEVSGNLEKTGLYVSRIRQIDTTHQVFKMSQTGVTIGLDIKGQGWGVVEYRDGFVLTLESMKIKASFNMTMSLAALPSATDAVTSVPGSLYYVMSFVSNGAKYSAILDVRNQDLAKLSSATGNVINSANTVVGTFELNQDGGITVKDLKGNVMR